MEARKESLCGMNTRNLGLAEAVSQENQHCLGHGKGIKGSQGRSVSGTRESTQVRVSPEH